MSPGGWRLRSGFDPVALLRTLLFLLIFYAGCVPTVLLAALAAFVCQDAVIWASRLWARWHRWCCRVVLGIEARFEGSLDQGQALYLLKHESMFEAIQTLAWFDRPIVVMKRELRSLPGWGFAAARHGSIFVDREAGPKAMRELIVAARKARESGRPIVLFPEGTRVLPGEAPPLKAGMAGLYKMLDLPVIPVAIGSGAIWRRGFVKRPGVVRVKVLDVIPSGLPREAIEAQVHAAINALNDEGQ